MSRVWSCCSVDSAVTGTVPGIDFVVRDSDCNQVTAKQSCCYPRFDVGSLCNDPDVAGSIPTASPNTPVLQAFRREFRFLTPELDFPIGLEIS